MSSGGGLTSSRASPSLIGPARFPSPLRREGRCRARPALGRDRAAGVLPSVPLTPRTTTNARTPGHRDRQTARSLGRRSPPSRLPGPFIVLEPVVHRHARCSRLRLSSSAPILLSAALVCSPSRAALLNPYPYSDTAERSCSPHHAADAPCRTLSPASALPRAVHDTPHVSHAESV